MLPIWNLKLNHTREKPKFLRARVDTCADVNLMPVSIYKKLFKDEDCTQIVPSNLQLTTYTNKKVKIIGSCNLYIIHPDTRCLEETRFNVAGNEGSILISCAASLALSLIKPREKLDHLPPKGNKNIIYNSADKMKKYDESQFKVQQTKLKTNAEKIADVCSRDEQSVTSSIEKSHSTCTKNIKNKKCQAGRSVIMWSVKPKKGMQLNKPTMLIKHKKLKKQIVLQEDDKNCQSKKCYGSKVC